MKTSTELVAEIGALHASIKQIEDKRQLVEAEYARALVAELGITRDQVMPTNTNEASWWDHPACFIKWLRENPHKPYFEWDGAICDSERTLLYGIFVAVGYPYATVKPSDLP